ncbi:hypothetical protein M3Y94_00765900 [Aphelenchoides besseyi]|nr:hypothetical protein M3Y94_00765900 [Aphelenchoides besseyi]KAI6232217.1 hypothetical protein M3Y95_00463300 [Aphelenchoides besseyi]
MYQAMISTHIVHLLLSVILLVVLNTSSVQSAPFASMAPELNPVMRLYKFQSTINQPYGTLPGRTMRSPMRGRNCFFSPVTCQLSRVPATDASANLRRRRRLLNPIENNEISSFGSRYRRNWPSQTDEWNNGLYY